MPIIIKKARNGFILEITPFEEEIFLTVEELFARLLLHFEGKASTFTGSSYGKVKIEYETSEA